MIKEVDAEKDDVEHVASYFVRGDLDNPVRAWKLYRKRDGGGYIATIHFGTEMTHKMEFASLEAVFRDFESRKDLRA